MASFMALWQVSKKQGFQLIRFNAIGKDAIQVGDDFTITQVCGFPTNPI